jgi:hypothetical protein
MNLARSKDEWLAARKKLAPRGRDEPDGAMAWLRRRDQDDR